MKNENDFPQTLQDAIVYFKNPDHCLEFMADLRWGGDPTCPRCQSKYVSFLSTRRIWKCLDCKKQFSVKVGTIFEDSALGLDKWLAALWMVANAKNGISTYEIARDLKVTQPTAWFMEQRIREAMKSKTFEKLAGTIEVDETFVGGLAKNMHKDSREQKIHGTGGFGKTTVMGFHQRNGKVRAKVIPNTDKKTIHSEVRANVETGSELYTDSMQSYNGLAPDYAHQSVDHAAKEYVRGQVHTNGIENFWSLWKRCIKGTHVHFDPKYMARYLDEEMFRYNNRTNNDAGRFLVVATSVLGQHLTHKELTGKIQLM
jgi:transposase-like protein